jgi:hypothetical protein
MPIAAQAPLLAFMQHVNATDKPNNSATAAQVASAAKEGIAPEKSITMAKQDEKTAVDFLLKTLQSKKPSPNWLDEVQQQFQSEFGTEIPNDLNTRLIQFEQQLAQQSLLAQQRQTVPVSKMTKGFSKAARLLQLKQALKNRQKSKSSSVEGTIVSSASIVAGWVLWKNEFAKVGWLNDGQFIREEGTNTAILAANWLARVSGEKPDAINALIAKICDLDAAEQVLYSDEKMQEAMQPFDLAETIQKFNEQLLMFWPIMKANQQTEFQELFLQREGILSETALGWGLAIVKAPYDALMEQHPIPWPISVINFPWTHINIEATW